MGSRRYAPGAGLPQRYITLRLRGVLSQTGRRGQTIMQAWPRRRGPPASATTIEQNTLFQKLAQLHKTAMDEDKVGARNIAWGSGYTWRDVLSRAAVGRLIVWGEAMSDDISTLLDTICTNPGAIIVRGDDGWICLFPSTDGYVLTIDPVTHRPAYLPLPAGGGSGLFADLLSGLPTQASTGFNAWVNQPTGSTLADTLSGVTVFQPSQSSNHNLALVHKLAPTPPYTVTALLAHVGLHINFHALEFGWWNGLSGGSSKLQSFHHSYADGMQLLDFTGYQPASIAAPGGTPGTMAGIADMLWYRLRDDGTTVTFSTSQDGVRFSTVYSIAKASGFLGATGYSHIAFGCDAFSRDGAATLMSYHEGS